MCCCRYCCLVVLERTFWTVEGGVVSAKLSARGMFDAHHMRQERALIRQRPSAGHAQRTLRGNSTRKPGCLVAL